MLEILENELDKEGIEYYVITGSTSKEERVRLVKEFNSGTVRCSSYLLRPAAWV